MDKDTISTPFGEFAAEDHGKSYCASFATGRGALRVHLDTDGMDAALNAFGRFAGDLDGLDGRLRAYASENMLESANDWLADSDDEDRPESYTKSDFIGRMADPELYFGSDGCVSAYYSDGGMFWGHTIAVYLDENGEPDEADICG